MKKIFLLFSISVCAIAQITNTTPLSQLPAVVNPSDSAITYVVDPTLTPQSRKMALTNIISKASGQSSEVQFRNSADGKLASSTNIAVREGALEVNTNLAARGITSGGVNITGGISAGGGQWEEIGEVARANTLPNDIDYAAEPSAVVDTDPVIFPTGTQVVKLWGSVGGGANPAIGYWESTNALDFVRYGANVISGYQRSYVMKEGSTYYFSGTKWPAQQQIDLKSSVNGVVWNTLQNAVITSGSTNVVSTNVVGGVTNVVTNTYITVLGNSSLFHDTNANAGTFGTTNVWFMVFDKCTNYSVVGADWSDWLAISTNGGTAWIEKGPIAGPAITYADARPNWGGVWFTKQTWTNYQNQVVGSYYFALGHATPNSSITLAPSDIYKFLSPDMQNWYSADFRAYVRPEITRGPFTGMFDGGGQVADPYAIEFNGQTYVYYDGIYNQSFGNNVSSIHVARARKALTASMNFPYASQLYLSGQAAIEGDTFIGGVDVSPNFNAKPNFVVEGTSPEIRLKNKSAGYNMKNAGWMHNSSGQTIFYNWSDDFTQSYYWMVFNRNGMTPVSMDLYAPIFNFTGSGSYMSWYFNNTTSGSHQWSLNSYGVGTGVDGGFSLNDATAGVSHYMSLPDGRHGINTSIPVAAMHVAVIGNYAAQVLESTNLSAKPLSAVFSMHNGRNSTNNSYTNLTYGQYADMTWQGMVNSQWNDLVKLRGIYVGDGSTKLGQIDIITMTNGVDEVIASFTPTNIVFYRKVELRGDSIPWLNSLVISNTLTASNVTANVLYITNMDGTSTLVPPPPVANMAAGVMPSRLAWGPNGLYWQNPRNTITWYDDFSGDTVSGSGLGWGNTQTGGAYANTLGSGIDGAVGGVLAIGAGTASGNYSRVRGNSSSTWFGQGEVYFEARVQIPILSTSSDQMDYIVGYNDRTTTTNTTDGVYFRICDVTNSFGLTSGTNWVGGVATPNAWECWASSNSVHSMVGTATVPTAATWYTVGIRVAADGSNAKYYVDGTCIATNTVNIPLSSARGTCPMFFGWKYNGANQRYMYIDYADGTIWLTTPR